MAIEVGNIIDGTVSGITKFGVFVDLGEKQTGLVHISEVAHGYVEDINTLLKVEDPVKVKVLSIDGNKIGLSIRQTQPKEGMDEDVYKRQHLRRTPCVRLLLYGNINILVFYCMGLLIYYKLTGIF